MATLNLPFSAKALNPVPLDYYYGPWTDLASAKANIPLSVRFDGLTVQITGLGNYYWTAADLTDTGLISKGANVTSGSGITLTGSAIDLGGIVTQNTLLTIDDLDFNITGNNSDFYLSAAQSYIFNTNQTSIYAGNAYIDLFNNAIPTISAVGQFTVQSTSIYAGFKIFGFAGNPSSGTLGDIWYNNTTNNFRAFTSTGAASFSFFDKPETFTAKKTFSHTASVVGLNVGSTTTDPTTPINGDLWYNSTNNQLNARINGITVPLGAGSTSSVTEIKNISFTGDGSTTSFVIPETGDIYIAFVEVGGLMLRPTTDYTKNNGTYTVTLITAPLTSQTLVVYYTGGDGSSGDWLLDGGVWSDTGEWDDTSTWID